MSSIIGGGGGGGENGSYYASATGTGSTCEEGPCPTVNPQTQ